MFILSDSKFNKENVQTVKTSDSLHCLYLHYLQTSFKSFFRNLIEPLILSARNLLGRRICTGWEVFREPKV